MPFSHLEQLGLWVCSRMQADPVSGPYGVASASFREMSTRFGVAQNPNALFEVPEIGRFILRVLKDKQKKQGSS
jgi:hypothetical protein